MSSLPTVGTLIAAFASSYNATIAATSTSQSVAMGGSGTFYLFQNVGTAECFVAVGGVNVVAVAGGAATKSPDGSLSVPAGAIVIYSFVDSAQGYVAAVCASGNTTLLRISQGN